MKKIRFLFLSLLAFPLFLSGMTVFADQTPPPDTDKAEQKGATEEQKTAVNCSADKMINGVCRMDVYNMLGIRQGEEDPKARTSVLTFVQDFFLGITFFIGTVVTIGFVLSGLFYVFAAADSGMKAKAKN